MRNISILTVTLICALCSMFSHSAETNTHSTAVLPEIVVTASRREVLLLDTADIVQVLDRRQIEAINPSSSGELLEYVTGTARSTDAWSPPLFQAAHAHPSSEPLVQFRYRAVQFR